MAIEPIAQLPDSVVNAKAYLDAGVIALTKFYQSLTPDTTMNKDIASLIEANSNIAGCLKEVAAAKEVLQKAVDEQIQPPAVSSIQKVEALQAKLSKKQALEELKKKQEELLDS